MRRQHPCCDGLGLGDKLRIEQKSEVRRERVEIFVVDKASKLILGPRHDLSVPGAQLNGGREQALVVLEDAVDVARHALAATQQVEDFGPRGDAHGSRRRDHERPQLGSLGPRGNRQPRNLLQK
eukprot:Amastigsp_a188018_7.p5 type:complete len:124 gc:universal Amastigsp_a188018_7:864-493(-)